MLVNDAVNAFPEQTDNACAGTDGAGFILTVKDADFNGHKPGGSEDVNVNVTAPT
ncbi:hypothetical protein FLJC2902T_26860 [Flavobacterium limnosediminis JC2902]|uniref:Uncharacterized protein n=1 Tax=Flavobacterium limnosediminis JC2902 TaxID=1341181 RepID=V6SI14_9FLAO|nr:hypothetical protein FLJC2902T_26860 [Flavobacterium limnosediminis JC2902]